ncbi:ribosome recycling factor [Shewanella sp. SNU WT4]|uniref:ribosome recycling factor family protein n=1 Tax=Shewanella sp. SNU WT4 TaxID=2590015 RepID=UPI00112A9985|nr:ribosome recycling factor family protein [Shewanella sp. SNU WT4]QDF66638.1 ribosome recycling factor [Shewanella sp. SNU WT4]
MKPKLHQSHICIALPALIHRIGREVVTEAQLIAAHHHCAIARVRRSRHWQLTGKAMDISAFRAWLAAALATRVAVMGGNSKSHNDSSNTKISGLVVINTAANWPYLLKKMNDGLIPHADKLETLTQKLARLLRESPTITLHELMLQTDCSESQARLARLSSDTW